MSQDYSQKHCFLDTMCSLLCLASLLKVQTQNTMSLYRQQLFSFSSRNKSTALRNSQVLRYIESLWFSDTNVMGFVVKWLATCLELRKSLLDSREACKQTIKQTILHSHKGLCILLINGFVSKEKAFTKTFKLCRHSFLFEDDL